MSDWKRYEAQKKLLRWMLEHGQITSTEFQQKIRALAAKLNV